MAVLSKVRVVQSKYESYYLHYNNPQGKRRRLSIGKDELHAHKMQLKFMEWLMEGKDPERELEKLNNHQPKTIKEFFPDFMQRHGIHKSKSMQVSYELSFRNVCRCPELSDTPLCDVTKAMVLDYMNTRILQDRVANASVNREAAFLKVMYSCAVEWDVLETNNLQGLKLLPEAPQRQVDISVQEIQTLLNMLPKPIADITEFSIYTGYRKENVLDLKIEQISFKMPESRDYVTLIVKGGKLEKFPLSNLASSLLKRVIGNRTKGHVFLNPKTQKRYVSIHKSFDKFVKISGLKVNGTKLRWHDLRHVFGTWLAQDGVSLDDLRHLFAHKNRSTTDQYIWVNRMQLGNVLDSMPQLQHGKDVARIGKVKENSQFEVSPLCP